MTPNPILTAGNAFRLVTNFTGSLSGVGNAATQNPGIQQFTGIPIGTVGDTATGELGVKTILLGGGSAVIGHVIVDSGTLTAVTTITNPVAISQTTPGTTNGVQLTGSQRAIAISAAAAGTIAAGKKSIGLIFSSDFVGTVGGIAFTGTADTVLGTPSITFTAPPGDTLGSLAITISAGGARLVTIG